jgi:glyoxylase I family protein
MSESGTRIVGASHVSFSVTDFDRSLTWYHDVLGAEVMFAEPGEDRRAALLTFPGTTLLVGLGQFHSRGEGDFDPTRTGLDHFAFAVETRDDLDRCDDHFDRHRRRSLRPGTHPRSPPQAC